MTLTAMDQRLAAQVADDSFSGLAGLFNLAVCDYETIREHLFKTSGGDVGRLIWNMSLHPAAAVLSLSRAAMKAYDADNFWENFVQEIGVAVPVTRRPDLAEAFCKAATRCIPGFVRANWEAMKHSGEFLAQAGLPLHHCGTFARVLRLAVDETGLPEPTDREGIADTVERMLGRSELHGQTIILKALRGPAGPLLVEAAAAAISAGDYGRFNSELAAALQQSFENLSSRAAGQTIRRPFLQLDRDGSTLEICCPHPPPARCSGAGCVWSINGTRHRAVHGQVFIFPVTRPERFVVELHGVNGGGAVKWIVDARPASWLRGLAAFHAQTGRQVRAEASGKRLLLPPGDYALLHEVRWQCDEAISQDEWPEMKMTLTRLTLRPGNSAVFYDGEEEFTLATSKAVWFDTLGRTFVASASGHRIHYLWNQWPTVWIPDDARTADWTVEVSGTALRSVVPLMLSGSKAGGLAACEPIEDGLFSSLPSGMHRLTMEVRHGQRVKHAEEWLFWAGLSEADGGNLRWDRPPANLLPDSVRGFRVLPDGLTTEPTSDRASRIGFQIGPETLTLQWQREGIVLESCEVAAGAKSRLVSHQLGESFPADEASKTHLRVSINPASKAAIFVNGSVFKRAESNCRSLRFDLSLAALAALYPDGGRVSLIADAAMEVPVAGFAKPLVVQMAALKAENNYRTLGCLIQQPAVGFRLRIKEIISGSMTVTDGMPVEPNEEVFFRPEGLPKIKCANTGPQTRQNHTGFGILTAVSETKWPEGIWWIEVELQSRAGSAWETLRDNKGGGLPLLIVRNPESPSADYREQVLWWGLGNRGGGGALPGQFPSPAGHECELVSLLREVGALLKGRLSDHVWKKQFSPLALLRTELAKRVNWLIDQGGDDAAAGMIEELNLENTTATPRSILLSAYGLVALPPGILTGMADGDHLRTCLLWCGRLAEADVVSQGYHRLELDPSPTLGSMCLKQADVAGCFNNGNRVRPDGNLPEGEELTAFDYQRHFARMSKARCDSEVEPASVVPLSGEHLGYAVQQFHSRRAAAEACSSLSNVNTVFSKAALMATHIKSLVPQFRLLMPQAVWLHPWPEVSVENDHLAESAVQFASVYALAARLAGEKRLSFREFNKWLREQPWLGKDQPQAVNQAVTTLICQAPELLGFFLMFWQLMIQTYPHD
jgi:hypothetical protein